MAEHTSDRDEQERNARPGNGLEDVDAALAKGEAELVPLPSSDTQAEHDRIRESNDRDQQLEREGKPSRHNQGYDEAADGPASPKIHDVTEEP